MGDSDPIKTGIVPDDLISVTVDMLSNIQFKLIGFIFIIFIFLSSDVFINRILSRINGAVYYKSSTSYGVILQGLVLVVLVILIDILITQKIL